MQPAVPDRQRNMGEPVTRIDGRLKVTGQARYAADVTVPNPAYACLVTSAIAKGAITELRLDEAKAIPGVLDILTYENASTIRPGKFFGEGGPAASTIAPLASPKIWHDGQIIAVVVADSPEAAQEAAYLVEANYTEERPTATFGSPGTATEEAAKVSKEHKDPQVGDAEAALRDADVSIDVTYETPTQHHNPIELFATICFWQDEKLTIYEPSQFVYGLRRGVADELGLDQANIRVVSRYVGGAFGSKGTVTARTALIALAARRLNRPVKLVVSRAQGFTVATYRAETKHHIRLGARRDGKLMAYLHEGWEVTSRPDPYLVGGTEATSRIYNAPNVATKVYVVHADRNTPGFMRSPPEVPYVFALETAMDELAVKLELDPIELRRINDTMKDPISGAPFTSRSLMPCFDEASRAFGWSSRNPQPGSMRDGDWRVGWGCATAVYPTQVSPAAARVTLLRNGEATVQIAAHEIGNGAYTVIGQMAADRLGLDLQNVQVELGDTELPPGPIAGGSVTTASACSAVLKACEGIREKLFRAVTTANDGPLAGRPVSTLELVGAKITAGDGEGEALDAAFDRLGVGVIEQYAEYIPQGMKPESMAGLYTGRAAITGGPTPERMMFAFGAEFVEVRVHAQTGEIRVPRAVGAFAAGRIMNPRTARSQYLGGMIWGISSALHEATEIDRLRARYVNDNLADYLVPVNADIQDIEVIMVPEEDQAVNPAGVKGLGELANVGTAAAISNAVYHATGKRIRKLPIRVEDVLLA